MTGRAAVLAEKVAKAADNTVARIWDLKYVLVFLFLLGTLLVAVRTGLMHVAPWVGRHAHAWTEAWNVIADICEIMFASISAVIVTILDAVKLVEGKHPTVNWPMSKKFRRVMVHDVMEITYILPELCHDYGTGYELVSGAFDRYVGQQSCMLLRALYPTPLRELSTNLLGWAVGGRDTAPFGKSNSDGSCDPPAPEMSLVCLGFSSGALILEVALPLLVCTVLFFTWVPVIAESISIVMTPVNETTELLLGPSSNPVFKPVCQKCGVTATSATSLYCRNCGTKFDLN